MKKTTLREVLRKDIDQAFSMKLVAFNDYERSWSVLTVPELASNFGRHNGHYAPTEICGNLFKELLDLPLYLPDSEV
jgi:hypothetical protein